jgi:hypothetical protein
MADSNVQIQIRGLAPVEKTASGYEWEGNIDVALDTPPQVLLAIVEDMLTSPEAKERIHDSLVMYMVKNNRLALSIQRAKNDERKAATVVKK